jgi:hypothetical protein
VTSKTPTQILPSFPMRVFFLIFTLVHSEPKKLLAVKNPSIRRKYAVNKFNPISTPLIEIRTLGSTAQINYLPIFI